MNVRTTPSSKHLGDWEGIRPTSIRASSVHQGATRTGMFADLPRSFWSPREAGGRGVQAPQGGSEGLRDATDPLVP